MSTSESAGAIGLRRGARVPWSSRPVRVGSPVFRSARAAAWVLIGALCVLGPSCSGGESVESLGVELAFDPAPPRVGDTAIELALTDAAGVPLQGATVRLEGNMNHAGMVPVFADARETEPGRYVAELELTMAGDWYLVVTARTKDGRELERIVPLPGVARGKGSQEGS